MENNYSFYNRFTAIITGQLALASTPRWENRKILLQQSLTARIPLLMAKMEN